MAYFPMFYNFNKKRVLVVGGGVIATEKLDKLVQFTKDITVITKDISLEANVLIKEHCLSLYQRSYKDGDIDNFDIVIVATDDINMQEAIYKESRGRDILVNSVDNIEFCDFIFPSFIKKGDLTVAISTSGASPAFAKQFRWKVESSIPNDIEDFLIKLKEIRSSMPKGKKRMQHLESIVEEYLKE